MHRWKVTSKEALQQISEYSEAGITVRGTYYAPGKPGEPSDHQQQVVTILFFQLRRVSGNFTWPLRARRSCRCKRQR